VERLTGRHPMRRRALWVQRSVVPFTLAACLLGVLVGAAAISAVKRGAGWDDPRITAVTTTATTPDPHRVDLDCWVATAGWTDPRGGSYVGTVSIPVDAPIGTAVPARLAADGAVRTAAGGAADMWTVLLLVGLGIGLVVIGGWAGWAYLAGRVADRLRCDSWQIAWWDRPPAARDHEAL
jgi:hypothetical protein